MEHRSRTTLNKTSLCRWIRLMRFERWQIAAIDTVREAGMVGYRSVYGAYNFPGDDPFHIRRIHGDSEFHLFRNWITCDENKVKKEREIQKILSAI